MMQLFWPNRRCFPSGCRPKSLRCLTQTGLHHQSFDVTDLRSPRCDLDSEVPEELNLYLVCCCWVLKCYIYRAKRIDSRKANLLILCTTNTQPAPWFTKVSSNLRKLWPWGGTQGTESAPLLPQMKDAEICVKSISGVTDVPASVKHWASRCRKSPGGPVCWDRDTQTDREKDGTGPKDQ